MIMSAFPDVGVNIVELETEDEFRIEIYQRNFARVQPFGVRWSEGIFETYEFADIDAFKKGATGGSNSRFTPTQVTALVGSNPRTYDDCLENIRKVFNVSESTAKRYLRKAIDKNFVIKTGNTYQSASEGVLANLVNAVRGRNESLHS